MKAKEWPCGTEAITYSWICAFVIVPCLMLARILAGMIYLCEVTTFCYVIIGLEEVDTSIRISVYGMDG